MYDISAALALCPAVRFIVVLELVVGTEQRMVQRLSQAREDPRASQHKRQRGSGPWLGHISKS